MQNTNLATAATNFVRPINSNDWMPMVLLISQSKSTHGDISALK